MTKRLGTLSAVLTAAALVSGSATALAQMADDTNERLEMLFGESLPYAEFFDTLKMAVEASNGDAVAELVAYPITVTMDGAPVTFTDATSFSNRYDEIFSVEIVAAVERQTYENLFANDQGVMIGAGEIWFGGVCRDQQCATTDIRIIAINPPAAEPAR